MNRSTIYYSVSSRKHIFSVSEMIFKITVKSIRIVLKLSR
jgi:hypothetical protein